MHRIDGSCCKHRQCNKCDEYRKERNYLAGLVIENSKSCPIQIEYICKYGFKNQGCKECYTDYLERHLGEW